MLNDPGTQRESEGDGLTRRQVRQKGLGERDRVRGHIDNRRARRNEARYWEQRHAGRYSVRYGRRSELQGGGLGGRST